MGPRDKPGMKKVRRTRRHGKHSASTTNKSVGKIRQVTVPSVDVQFDGDLPAILNALETENPATGSSSKWRSIWAKARCAPSLWISTEGLVRGHDVIDTGSPITVPVGG